MPPKPKFARREIVEAALDLVSRRGPEALTARNLGERLGSSARPIFTVFQGMDELRQEVRAAAMARFASYADRAPADVPEFKRAGVQMLLFAQEEPRLYQLLFVNGSREAASFADVFGELGPMAEHCVAAIRRDYALSDEDARLLFEHMWIYTFGLGTLCARRRPLLPGAAAGDALHQLPGLAAAGQGGQAPGGRELHGKLSVKCC